jgi:hypothetical protein
MKKLYDGMNNTHGKVRGELFALQKAHSHVLEDNQRMAQQLQQLEREKQLQQQQQK